MQRCPECSRHVWERESRCPFCAASLYVQGSAPFAISAIVGLTLFACGGDPGDDTTAGSTSDTSAGSDSMSSTNDVTTNPTDADSDSTSSAAATSDSSSSSSSSTSASSTDSTSTTTTETSSTSDSSSTSTTESTSSTSTSESSSTGDSTGTSGDTEGDTMMTTTGGDCTGPGEVVCDMVCVNTQDDNQHCGECFNECNEGFCDQGECVVVLPYGAPMPEPLWI